MTQNGMTNRCITLRDDTFQGCQDNLIDTPSKRLRDKHAIRLRA